MRILVDTHVLISAILFPRTRLAQTLLYITEHHDVVLSDLHIYELREVL
jgi:predicted nucleic acid-binding protein